MYYYHVTVDVLRVAIVDDEDLVRHAYRTFLAAQENCEVVGEACDGSAGIALFAECRPDVMLMDLKMPGMSGVKAIEAILVDFPDACIVALTTFGTYEAITAALGAGAAGYLIKGSPSATFVDALWEAHHCKMPMSSGARVAVAAAQRAQRESVSSEPVATDLSQQQVDLLHCLDQGLTNKEIAERLFLGEATVRQYLHRLGRKLGANTRSKMVHQAHYLGILPALASPSPSEVEN
jgi:DNA-binding NarL/FixJ family response regulator